MQTINRPLPGAKTYPKGVCLQDFATLFDRTFVEEQADGSEARVFEYVQPRFYKETLNNFSAAFRTTLTHAALKAAEIKGLLDFNKSIRCPVVDKSGKRTGAFCEPFKDWEEVYWAATTDVHFSTSTMTGVGGGVVRHPTRNFRDVMRSARATSVTIFVWPDFELGVFYNGLYLCRNWIDACVARRKWLDSNLHYTWAGDVTIHQCQGSGVWLYCASGLWLTRAQILGVSA